MTGEFKDKVALVTGAASGIGAAIARELATGGAELVVADLEQESANRIVEGIRANGGRRTPLPWM
ncbi:SDR family NAD(P)-dependent oxidoreductase [Chelativorans sp. AA-79]|uniref:SDR family NAD(P)-dependent oxidoreductase n=1 Tax=Chelativorans sp. AA-79 TaxID=3028735 RepID=UPI0023F6A6B7|nr:SDR family NAD(P)-dependent oxidoreductase [Chelativorans sp. AA-79]WEX10843.1 SDR family NAD(P)-dependent oxidoreductase [Chelativorans sp. AA-79]